MRVVSKILPLLVGVTALLASAVVSAQVFPEADEELAYRSLRVVLLPLRDYRGDESSLFFVGSEKANANTALPLLARIRAELESALEKSPKIRLLSRREALGRPSLIGGFKRGVELVRDRYHLARDFYDDLRLKEAAESLEIAAKGVRKWSLEVLDPSLASKTALITGLNAFERGETGKAHIALKRSLLLRPAQRFRKGYYPVQVETALNAAWADVQSMESKDLTMGPERTEALLKQMGADVAVTGYLQRQGNEDVLRLVAYDRQTRAFTMREILPLGEENQDGLSRAMSRWFSCLEVPLRKEDKGVNSGGSFRVDSQLSHGLYLAHPTREIFNNLGFSLNLAYQIQENVDIATRLQLFTSIPDTRKDLQGSLTSVRWILGAGFAFGGKTWRWFIRPGVELHYVGQLSVLTDPDCKFFGIAHARCPEGSVTDTDQALLGGLHLATGSTIHLGSSVYLVVEVGGSVYISFREDSNLNYLIDSGLGLGYRF